jgi:hypothetical protein
VLIVGYQKAGVAWLIFKDSCYHNPRKDDPGDIEIA